MNRYPILAYLSLVSPIIPISAGIFRSRLIKREMKVLVLYLFLGSVFDNISMWFIQDARMDMGLWHIYIIIEYIFVMFIVFSWQESHKMKKLFQT